jgi:hypothetical protein
MVPADGVAAHGVAVSGGSGARDYRRIRAGESTAPCKVNSSDPSINYYNSKHKKHSFV